MNGTITRVELDEDGNREYVHYTNDKGEEKKTMIFRHKYQSNEQSLVSKEANDNVGNYCDLVFKKKGDYYNLSGVNKISVGVKDFSIEESIRESIPESKVEKITYRIEPSYCGPWVTRLYIYMDAKANREGKTFDENEFFSRCDLLGRGILALKEGVEGSDIPF